MRDHAAFEARLAAAFDVYAAGAPTAVDAAAVARQAAASAPARPRLADRWSAAFGGRRLAMAALALLLLAALAGAAAVGARLLWAVDRGPTVVVPAPDVYAGAYDPVLPGVDPGLPYPPRATVLDDGRVLWLRGDNELESWKPGDRWLQPAGSTVALRTTGAEMVPLLDGRVLIVGGDQGPWVADANGGRSAGWVPSTGEIYDPATRTSTPAGPMTTSRWEDAVVRLADGRVLVSGGLGFDEDGPTETALASAEIFDPATGRFEATGSMAVPRAAHLAVVLADGRVLIVGGSPAVSDPPDFLVEAEIFDPATGAFTPAGSMADGTVAAAVRLADGRVLVIHGWCTELGVPNADPVATEIYDPGAGRFVAGPTMPHCVDGTISVPDGRVLVHGFWWEGRFIGSAAGWDRASHYVGWSALLDPATGALRMTEPQRRYRPATLLLPDGRPILVGGVALLDGAPAPWAEVFRWPGRRPAPPPRCAPSAPSCMPS